MKNKFGIIILAAGNSSRLGQPKQLLDFEGKSLLQNIISNSIAVQESNVIVVTGSNKELILSEIQNSNVNHIYNERWQSGMASSINIGVSELLKKQPETEFCIITVCDQPFITTNILQGLIDKFQNNKSGIIASEYAGTLGTPVLFPKKYFKDLTELRGNEGAKKLLSIYKDDVLEVPFEKGEIDIDTDEDYEKLKTYKRTE